MCLCVIVLCFWLGFLSHQQASVVIRTYGENSEWVNKHKGICSWLIICYVGEEQRQVDKEGNECMCAM